MVLLLVMDSHGSKAIDKAIDAGLDLDGSLIPEETQSLLGSYG